MVLACAEQLGRSVHGENIIELPSSWGTGNLAIPRELEDGFIRTTRQLNPNYFSVDGGIEGAVMHFNKITKSSSEVVSSDVTYHVAVIDLMMATWLAKTVRGSRDYEFIARYPSNTAFARQIDYWGMTIERFFDHFENVSSPYIFKYTCENTDICTIDPPRCTAAPPRSLYGPPSNP